uniref:Major sperm protein n=2 Tax=Parascaris univalens TaxID=6257 RepID=A0A915CEL4_PARUN
MFAFITLIAIQLSLHLYLIVLCKTKKQPVVTLAPPKPEEKLEERKKDDEKEVEKKSEADKDKKEAEKKDDEKKADEKNKDEDNKEGTSGKKEGEDEKMPCSPNELHWRSEDGQPKYGTQKILLMNLIGKRQAFKIKCTDNNIYTVKPTYTFLEKDEVVDIEVTRVEGGEVKEDQIFLFYTLVR